MTTPDGGIERLERWLAADPASKAFLPLAEEHRRAGHLDRAIEILRAGLAKNPGYVTAQVALARVYLQKGDLDEARALLRRLVKTMPENLLAVRLLAEADAAGTSAAGSDTNPNVNADPPPPGPEAATAGPASPPSPDASEESSFAAVDVGEEEAADMATGPETRAAREESMAPPPAAEEPDALSGTDGEVPGDLPESIRTLTLARLYRRQGYMERAAVVYRDVLVTDPGNRAAQRELAAIVPPPADGATDGPEPEPLEEIVETDLLVDAAPEAEPPPQPEPCGEPEAGRVEPEESAGTEMLMDESSAPVPEPDAPAATHDLAAPDADRRETGVAPRPDPSEEERRRKVAALRAWLDRIRAEG
jgi:tetratricopeptide (TPR) repeat protein